MEPGSPALVLIVNNWNTFCITRHAIDAKEDACKLFLGWVREVEMDKQFKAFCLFCVCVSVCVHVSICVSCVCVCA